MTKKNNNKLERHHINPALILKFFKDNESGMVRFLKNDILFNEVIKEKHNHYCSEDSNKVIIKELNFFSDLALIEINKIIKDKNYTPIELTSLETSYNYYENSMAIFLDDYLDGDIEISDFYYNVIGSYIEISETRALKFFNNMNLCPIIESDPYKNFSNLLKIVGSYKNLSNIDGLTLNEQAIYLNILIHFLKHTGFKSDVNDNSDNLLNVLMTDFIKIYNLINNKIINKDVVKTNKKEIHIFETQESFFLTSDNPVVSIYRNNNPFIFDLIAEDLFDELDKINKLTFLTISPNIMIVKTDNESAIKDKQLKKNIVSRINTLILYSSDVWVVSNQTIIGDKSKVELFDFMFYESIEESCFYSQKTCNLLNTINYYIGNFNKNIIFHFNIVNPLKETIKKINSTIPSLINDDTELLTESIGHNFNLKTYKNSNNIVINWLPNEGTMKFIQSLNYEYTFLILYTIRDLLSEILGYCPIEDNLQFLDVDKNGIIRKTHSLIDYASSDKNKTLDGINYVFLKPKISIEC